MLDFPNPSGGTWHREPEPEKPDTSTEMADPYSREATEIEYVLVERVIRRRVPDYEAEVLCRNGWRVLESDETLQNGA